MRISDWSSDVCSSDLIFEIGRVGTCGMIAVDAVLREHLPIAADRIFLRAADDRHALRRLFGDELQIVAGAREIGREIFAVGGEAHEEKVAEPVEARRGAELLARIVLIVGGIAGMRSEERRGGKECGSKGRSRWAPYP